MKFLTTKTRVFLIMMLMVYTAIASAEPWYSGPLLSEPAIVTPVGHGFFQTHLFKVNNYGAYDEAFNFFSLPSATTKEIDVTFNYGITSNAEAELFMTYLNNKTEGRQAGSLGDTTISLATQLVLQNGRKWPPNLKVIFRQLFPTGRYDELKGSLYGTDATGQGSYLTMFAANMEHVTHLFEEHYLVQFATVTVTLPTRVQLKGFSIYGGNDKTDGRIWPGNSISFNLAAEYSPNQHWGFIMETFIFAQKLSHFKGELGQIEPRFNRKKPFYHHKEALRILFNNLRPSHLNLGSDQDIGHGNIAQFTLAPAIDYSFTKNISLTGGVWFTVSGKNSPAFYTPMLQFTANW